MNALRVVFLLLITALTGCFSLSDSRVVYTPAPTTPPEPPEHFSFDEGRDETVIAQFRESPAPPSVTLYRGEDLATERNRLAREGYVLVARSHFVKTDPRLKSRAEARAVAIGAEQALLFDNEPVPDGLRAPGQYANEPNSLVAYFVKYKLPFGATFRDLNGKEKSALGVTGGVKLGSIIERTPAADANLMAGDAIVRFNGGGFTGKAAFQKLLMDNAGKSVTLLLVRDGSEVERVVRVGMPRAQ